jgi:hypothetical protein
LILQTLLQRCLYSSLKVLSPKPKFPPPTIRTPSQTVFWQSKVGTYHYGRIVMGERERSTGGKVERASSKLKYSSSQVQLLRSAPSLLPFFRLILFAQLCVSDNSSAGQLFSRSPTELKDDSDCKQLSRRSFRQSSSQPRVPIFDRPIVAERFVLLDSQQTTK